MANYLVVAHQTATSRTLIGRAKQLADHDHAAAFTLLIPATHPTDLLTWDPSYRFVWNERQVMEQAQRKAAEGWRAFEQAGLPMESALIGDASPVLAAEDELRDRPDYYTAILLSTLPPARSRWIAQDVTARLARLGLPVVHVSGWSEPAGGAGAVIRGAVGRFPQPRLVQALRRIFDRPEGTAGLVLIASVMVLYLIGSATLALTINRTFFLNDAIAIVVFGGLMAWLVISMPRVRR